jgi:hypothetical protein
MTMGELTRSINGNLCRKSTGITGPSLDGSLGFDPFDLVARYFQKHVGKQTSKSEKMIMRAIYVKMRGILFEGELLSRCDLSLVQNDRWRGKHLC